VRRPPQAPNGGTGPAAAALLTRPADADTTRVKVMICDDSVVIRGALARMLQEDPGIEVVARVPNGRAAVDELARQSVEVVVLDIEMPVMDGIQALPLLLRADPRLRIIMASTLTTRGADIAMQALRLGAADYIPKPSAAAIADASFARELVAKVRGLGRLRRRGGGAGGEAATERGMPAPFGSAGAGSLARNATPAAPPRSLSLRPASAHAPQLLAIGSSTGGPQALFAFVAGLGTGLRVPVILTQHMPASFTPILADHLTRLGAAPCAEASDGEMLRPGFIYLAPGDRHLLIERGTGSLRARLSDGPAENFCRPAVDPMLRSATAAIGGKLLVVMLTGMGHDGLEGTRAVIEAGGAAIAQDEETSVVWGMPGAIAQAGLCHRVLQLPMLAPAVLDLLQRRRA
jgi:two-component system chemotaxis response regulator CheB